MPDAAENKGSILLPRFVKVIHDKHGISSDLVKEIVGRLADPIMIIRSTGLADPIAVFESNSVAGRLVFMVDVTDANGATVILPVQLDAQHSFATVHILTTAYSKEKKRRPEQPVV